MTVDPPQEITEMLVAWSNGDETALAKLTPLVYQELHRLAHLYLLGERAGHVLQTTALVNEAYVRLVNWKNVEWQDRAHFFGVAAHLMRRILVDFARQRNFQKRSGEARQVLLEEAATIAPERCADFIALDDALNALAELDRRQSLVVELRFFGGLSLNETAEALRVSVGTVRRDWSLARAWLYRELKLEGCG
jgi:RNA polymerase sigma factor (TIGR02999 family)